MIGKQRRFDLCSVNHATGINKLHLDSLRRRLQKYDEDPRKDDRLKKGECRFCYYIRGKIGGAMITKKFCDACGIEVLYSSTCVGSVCIDCGSKHRICTHCGGDLNGRSRRKL